MKEDREGRRKGGGEGRQRREGGRREGEGAAEE